VGTEYSQFFLTRRPKAALLLWNVFAVRCDLHGFLSMQPIQARVHEVLKRDAEEFFQNLGLDSATAIRVFLRKVVATRSIPFSLEEEPFFSPVEEDEILSAMKEAPGGILARTKTQAETQAFLDSIK
jgi:DNA-damage-inducible protein J